MNNYSPDIHHRHSIRLKGYDYSRAGLYFITICVKDRECLFGKIENDKLVLNDAGKIAEECWLKIPKHFPNTVLREYIIMPNHVHGIIELIKTVSPNDQESSAGVQNFEPLQSPNKSLLSIRVENILSQRNEYQKIIPHSLGSIVRGFKIGVTKWFRNNSVGAIGVQNSGVQNSGIQNSGIQNSGIQNSGVQNFEPQQIWQRNYYEHIIRNEQSYKRIADYIINNPKNWQEDKFFDG